MVERVDRVIAGGLKVRVPVPKSERISLGELIRRRRVEGKMTQAELARLIGVKSHTYISKIENGEQRGSYEKLAKISLALRLDWDEMMKTGEIEIPQLYGNRPGDDSMFPALDDRFKHYHPKLKMILYEIAPILEKYIYP